MGDISFGMALYASIVCTFVGWFAYGIKNFGITSPIVAGPLVGLLLGDLQTGVEIGAILTLTYLGVVGIGAAIPVNETTATTIAVTFAILSGLDTSTAVALAVPASILGQLDRMAAWTVNSSLMHVGDRYAKDANFKGMERLVGLGSLVFWIAEFIPVFLSIYFGAGFVSNLNENMPAWINSWLTLATGMLPALGFGMLFSMMYKREYIPYFMIGFVFAAYFDANLQAVAVIGAALALLNFYNSKKEVVI